jgi:hypothetical protein
MSSRTLKWRVRSSSDDDSFPLTSETAPPPARSASLRRWGAWVSIVVSIEPGKVRHCEALSRQIARGVNGLALPCRTFLCASIAR